MAKRMTKACDRCHARKVRCSGTMPCERCVQAGVSEQCVYTPSVSRRGPRSGYVVQLERRVRELEQLASHGTGSNNRNNTGNNNGLSAGLSTGLSTGSSLMSSFDSSALVTYFFNHLLPFLPIFHQHSTLLHKNTPLETAVCAFAAHFAARDCFYPYAPKPSVELATRLLKRAKLLFQDIIHSNSIESLQTCLLIAATLCACGDIAEGWVFCGHIVRLALLLKLNFEPSDAESSSMSDIDIEIRRRVWWLTFIVDRGFSSGIRVPPTIHDEFIETILPAMESDFQTPNFSYNAISSPQCTLDNWDEKTASLTLVPGDLSYWVRTAYIFGKIQIYSLKASRPDASDVMINVATGFPNDDHFQKLARDWHDLHAAVMRLYQSFPPSLLVSVSEMLQHPVHLPPDQSRHVFSYPFEIATRCLFHYSRMLLYFPRAFEMSLPLVIVPWSTQHGYKEVKESAEEMLRFASLLNACNLVAVSFSPLCGGSFFLAALVYLSECILLRQECAQSVHAEDKLMDVLKRYASAEENVKSIYAGMSHVAVFWNTVDGLKAVLEGEMIRHNVQPRLTMVMVQPPPPAQPPPYHTTTLNAANITNDFTNFTNTSNNITTGSTSSGPTNLTDVFIPDLFPDVTQSSVSLPSSRTMTGDTTTSTTTSTSTTSTACFNPSFVNGVNGGAFLPTPLSHSRSSSTRGGGDGWNGNNGCEPFEFGYVGEDPLMRRGLAKGKEETRNENENGNNRNNEGTDGDGGSGSRTDIDALFKDLLAP